MLNFPGVRGWFFDGFLPGILRNLCGKLENRVNALFLQQTLEDFRIPMILTVFPLMGAKNLVEKEFKR